MRLFCGPLPYADPDRLVMVWETVAGNDRRSVAPGNYVDWRDHNKTFRRNERRVQRQFQSYW